MQHEESKSFQGVADCDLINARLHGAASRSRAVANRPRKLQSDDVVDLQDLQPVMTATAIAAVNPELDNLGSETELDAREVQGEGQDPGELATPQQQPQAWQQPHPSGAAAGPDDRDDATDGR